MSLHGQKGAWILAVVLAGFLVVNGSTHAQALKASVLGVVTDSSGAAIAGANISVKNIGTGIIRTARADDQGRYNVPDLDIGTYEVVAEKAGFRTIAHGGIQLTVGSQVVVDAVLQVGASEQTVTVEGQVTQVETTSSALGNLVEATQMRQLPLNGRNYTQLLMLAPGVQLSNDSGTAAQGRGAQFSVSGSRTFGQAFLLDDTDVADFQGHGAGSGAIGSSLGIDGIAEFQVLTNTYSAQYGGSGAVLNAVSKGGTNSFHGSVFEFLRNSAIQTRNYFDPASTPPFRRNQFGGSIGGPIKRDKAFFFVNYEGLRQFLSQTDNFAVPDAAAHQGYLPNSAGVEAPVNTPGTPGLQSPSSCTAAYTPTSNCVLANMAPTLALYPVAAGASTNGIGSVTETSAQLASENYVLTRFDYTFSGKDSLFVRYIRDYARNAVPEQLPLWTEVSNTFGHYATIEERHLVSSSLINVARFSFVRPAETTTIPEFYPALNFYAGATYNGEVIVSGLGNAAQNYLGPISTDPGLFYLSRYSVGDDVLWTHGAHNFRFGMSLARYDDNTAQPNRFGEQYTFPSLTNFLKGIPSQLAGPLPGHTNDVRDFRLLFLTPYFQDDWKLTRKLTVNIGLRYDWTSNYTEAHNNLSAVVNPPPPQGSCVGVACYLNVPNTLATNPSWRNFDPRIGIAYDLFGDHKTSVRAGFGIFHDVITDRMFGAGYWFNPPFITVSVTSGQQALVYGCVSAGCPGAGNFSGGSAAPSTTNGVNYQTDTTPYMMQYNLNIQRELPGAWILTVGYVGSQGRHLFLGKDTNPPNNTGTAQNPVIAHLVVNANGTGTIVSNPRINTTLATLVETTTNANSNYNSLQTSLNHRFAHGLQTQISYTYSRSLDFDSGANSTEESYSWGVGSGTVENPYYPRADYGPSAFNKTHNLTANAVYTLPFHGNKFVEGWDLSGILSVTSGFPQSVTTGSFDVAGLGTPSVWERVNLAPGCTAKSATLGSKAKWFNPACFTLPAVGTFGNLGKNSLISPGLRNVDFAIMKETKVPKISETFVVQFRAECFNLFNHTNLGIFAPGLFSQGPVVNGVLTGTVNPAAGTFSSTIAPQRTMQFGLKILF